MLLCIYTSEDGKCFILDFWIYPEYRNPKKGKLAYEILEQYTKSIGASYYELNSEKANSIPFWKLMALLKRGKMNTE